MLETAEREGEAYRDKWSVAIQQAALVVRAYDAEEEPVEILHLTLHRQWFDAIARGEKHEEYREVKPYWTKRIENRMYDEIHFRNGYRKDAPFMRVEYMGWNPGEWDGKAVYVLRLGKIMEVRNWP
ncbi:MAG: hypothetical protein ABIH46_00265 [Chloroflexota bacterium]